MSTEPQIDIPLVRHLLHGQFPELAHLPIEPVASTGTDNAIFRLGSALAIRLPRILRAAGQVEKEIRWLPKLAPLLPLAIPVPLGAGVPAEGYPWHWSIVPWFEGETALIERIADPNQAATVLGQFISALQSIDASEGPLSGKHNEFRGVDLSKLDAPVREAIPILKNEFDAKTLTAAWEEALATPLWNRAPVWIHGDLYSGNILAHKGKLCAIIDFGLLGVGDPACDLIAAWTFLPDATRKTFRAVLDVDEATWARGRGWALSFGLIALAYYLQTNRVLADVSRRTILEVLASR